MAKNCNPPHERGLILFRLIAWAMVLVSGGILFHLPQKWLSQSPTTYYVSVDGSDWGSGSSPETSFRTIAHACRLVDPGDQVVVLPGTYQERIHLRRGGTAESPVVLEAYEPGTVTISWDRSLNEVVTDWINEGNGIYSTQTTSPIYVIREGSSDIFRMKFGGIDGLKKLVGRDHAFPAFWYQSGKLFLFLNGRHPTDASLVTHRDVPEPREWGEMKSANVWVEADHIEIHGFRFEFGIGAGIRIWNSQHLVVDDCSFHGCKRGITDQRGVTRAGTLKVIGCHYDNFPQYKWEQQWLDWKNVYAHYAANGLISSEARDIEVRHCLVTHCADGMGISPTTGGQARIERNWICQLTDDGIELDGDAVNVEITENLIENCKCSLGISPVRMGPVSIQRNVLVNDLSSYGALFKLLSPWEDDQGNTVPIRNVQIVDNIGMSRAITYWNPSIPVRDLTVRDNLFLCNETEIAWPPITVLENNQTVPMDIEATYKTKDLQQVLEKNHAGAGKVVSHLSFELYLSCGPAWVDTLSQTRVQNE